MSDPRSQRAECPDLETLAAYIDKRLSATERAAVEAHLADCDVCREVVADTIEAMEEGLSQGAQAGNRTVGTFDHRAATNVPVSRRWPWLAGLGIAAAVLLGFGLWSSRSSQVPRALEVLAQAPRDTRFSEGRLSIDRRWTPAAPVLRGAADATGRTLDVQSAALTLARLTEADESAEGLHARGLALLASGAVDASVASLDKAAARAPTVAAEVRADLAAALLERYRRRGGPEDAVRALQETELALTTSPKLLPALFNHALALEAAGQRERARGAWQAYVNAERDSAWSREAALRQSRDR